MNLLFVAVHVEASARAVPLGPAMLAAALNRRLPGEVHTGILDLYLHQSPAECAARILDRAPGCVGFSMYVWNRRHVLEIAARLKQDAPGIVLFAGGPEASTDRESVLQNDAIDFVLTGECEESIVPAVQHLLAGGDPRRIPESIAPAPVVDLSVLPSPFLDGVLDPKDYDGMLWELSRGCPFTCDFCYESRGTPGVRRFPLDRIRKELRLFRKAGVEQVFVLDPTFNHDKETAKTILTLLAEEAPGIYYHFEVRSESIDAEMAALFGALDCSLQIGLQSSSRKVLKKINRTINTQDCRARVLLLHEAGVTYGFDLIAGLPGDTLDGFRASLDFVMGFIPNHVDIFPLAVLPGTRLRETAPSFGLNYQAEAPYRVISSPTFSREDMAAAADMARAFELFYNRGKAVPWFAIITDALELKPSAFIEQFAGWSKGKPETDIIALQKDFVAQLLGRQGKAALAELARDMIAYFGYSEMSCDGAFTVSFNHQPFDMLTLMEEGLTDLKKLLPLLPRTPCTVSFNVVE